MNGYQVKIDPTPCKWTGGIFDDFGPDWQWYYSLEKDVRAQEAFKIAGWNTFRVEAVGKDIKVWVNGVPTTHLTHGKYSDGYIACKIHALGNKPAQEKVLIHFKNIRIITTPPPAHSHGPWIFPRRLSNENSLPPFSPPSLSTATTPEFALKKAGPVS